MKRIISAYALGVNVPRSGDVMIHNTTITCLSENPGSFAVPMA